jgi:UDP-N-acetylmuramyl pentapeptide phosphotransferase/UDP-N-acetylglucosamine-1-phosphate transferase
MLDFTIGAAALGFLYNNFHPAKVFMGDAGSIPLGFLAAAMGLYGWQLGYWPAWFPLMVFSPFIVDASATLVKRALRGARITEAHREHYYQRAIQMGWGHRNVAFVEYVLMLGVGVSALVFIQQSWSWSLFLVWAGIYTVLMLVLDFRWKKRGSMLDTVNK